MSPMELGELLRKVVKHQRREVEYLNNLESRRKQLVDKQSQISDKKSTEYKAL